MRFVALALLILTSACAQIGLTAASLPSHFDDVQRVNGIVYDTASNQKLDIYLPPHADKATAPLPVVVFFYGGRWETGSRSDYAFIGSAFAKRGFITVIPDYRKYPDVKFPAFVEDAASAIAWVHDHIGDYGGDVDAINVSGHSAGAHIVALAITDPHYLKKFGMSRRVVKSFVGLAGPYDFTPDEKDLMDMFGPPANYPNMQAPTFVDGHEPPMLLLWGATDTDVKKYNMDKLATTIHAKHGCVMTKIYPDTDHIAIVADLSWLGDSKTPVLDDMVGFFQHPARN